MVQEVRAMEDHVHVAAVEAEAVAEVAAEAVVTLPDEAEDLPATRPVKADHARVVRSYANAGIPCSTTPLFPYRIDSFFKKNTR